MFRLLSKGPTELRKRIRREAGSALLTAVISLGTVTLSFYFLSDVIVRERNQVLQTTSALSLRLALNSITDYMISGLRQRWCFNKNLLHETNNCNLSHAFASSRLLLTTVELFNIEKLIDNGVNIGPYISKTQIALDSFEILVPLTNISTSHPLFPVTTLIRSKHINAVYVKVTRLKGPLIPNANSEATLDLNIELADANGKHPVFVGSAPLRTNSRLVMTPREIGTFALLAPRDLRLDRSSNASPQFKGDLGFGASGTGSGTKGLVFKSPVFVNENIRFADGVYAPVTFSDQVVIGSGAIINNGIPFRPKTAGGPKSSLWSEITDKFGGFLAGVTTDGKLDRGLKMGWQTVSASPVDATLMKQCADRVQFLTDVNKLKSSYLYGKLGSHSGASSTYRVKFTQGDPFTPQPSMVTSDTTKWSNPANDLIVVKNNSDGPVMQVRLQFGGEYLVANVSVPGSATFYPNNGPKVSEAQARVAAAEADVMTKTKTYNDLVGLIQLEKGKSPVDDVKVAELTQQADAAKAAIDSSVSAQTSAVAQLATLRPAPAGSPINPNVPAITVALRQVFNDSSEEPNLVDLDVATWNPDWPVDAGKNPIAPSIGLIGFDPSTNGGQWRSPEGSPNQTPKYIKFGLSGASLLAPAATGSSPTAGPDPEPPADPIASYGDLDDKCEYENGATGGQAFASAPWDYDFSPQTRHSWNFACDNDKCQKTNNAGSAAAYQPSLTLSEHNSRPIKGVATFMVYSIVGVCTIEPGATFVSGFLVCDKLEIKPRTQPLKIIGSIIAGELYIDPSAFNAGITWSSIYWPQATQDLRAAGVLATTLGAACSVTPDRNEPIWNPIPSLRVYADRGACNVISLRAKAQPFQWTGVDPDCGIIPSIPGGQTCKNHLDNFTLVELMRESGL